jgi:multicomponent Na+:H+ antiporter subunit F
MMYAAAALALAFAMALALVRALLGPTIYDRILAVNMFGTKTVLLLAVTGFVMGRPEFADIALAYALINFIGVLAVLKFFKEREMGTPRPHAANAGKEPPEHA